MKIAILADIHGNFPALEAVIAHIDAWRPDLVVFAGDLVNRGPRSPECLQLALDKHRDQGWHIISGNHEDYLTSLAAANGNQPPTERDFYQPIHWVCDQLHGQIETLRQLPNQFGQSTESGGDIFVTHGSNLGKREGIFPRMTDDEIAARIDGNVNLYCVGHTHVPLIRQVNDTLIVNAGSVGLPFDGDRQAAYAQIEENGRGWKGRIIRLDYDMAQAERDYIDSGFTEGGGAITTMLLFEFRHAKSLLHRWTVEYQESILAGELTVADSVARFMTPFSP